VRPLLGGQGGVVPHLPLLLHLPLSLPLPHLLLLLYFSQ
jgi:hypothetical protein